MKRRKGPPKTQISTRIDNEIYAAMQEIKQEYGYTDSQMIEQGLPLLAKLYLKEGRARRVLNAATLDEDWLAVLFCAHLREPLDPLQETSRDALLKMLRLLPTMPWFNDVLASYKRRPL